MKFMKKIGALILSFLLVFSFVACDEEESSSSDESSRESQSESSSSQSESSSSLQSESSSSSSSESSSSSQSESSSSSSSESSSSSQSESSSSSTTSSNSSGGNMVTEWESNASAEVKSKVESLLESKHRLTYNEDGSFKVAVFADMHINVEGDAGELERAKANVKKIVDEQKPDLVILTGDNIISSDSEAKARQNIDAIVSYLEQNEIPWCHVYGNHDHEGSIGKSAQQAIYQSYEYCISKDVTELSGTGNYVHGIYKADGSLGAVIYLLDSGDYVASGYDGYYDFIKQDQIDWYKQTSELLQEYNNGELVYGMMAFHIPLIENRDANTNKDNTALVYEYSGGVNEAMCPSEVDTTLLETIWERGDVKAIVTGHDHTNDYMFNYKGVKLTSSPTISEMGYSSEAFMGSRVFELNASTITNIPTYVAYLIKRLNPDDFGKLSSNVIIEDGEDAVKNPAFSGWSSESLEGTVTISVGEDKGVDGSNAICVTREGTSNFEFVFDIDSMGKLGDNKYIVVWMDLTSVEFRKACVGLASSDGTKCPYRTDDNDNAYPKFYYLADGSSSWQQLSHGKDGCFGTGDSGSQAMTGKKGYFAFSIDDLRQGSKTMGENTLVSGFYFYGSLANDSYSGVPFYIDDIRLVEDYTTALN